MSTVHKYVNVKPWLEQSYPCILPGLGKQTTHGVEVDPGPSVHVAQVAPLSINTVNTPLHRLSTALDGWWPGTPKRAMTRRLPVIPTLVQTRVG
jgi:hypothetical protein